MNDLIKAAQAALAELDEIKPQSMGAHVYRAREDLRAALAQASDPLPGMSPMNRTISYGGAMKLRELGYVWDDATEKWVLR